MAAAPALLMTILISTAREVRADAGGKFDVTGNATYTPAQILDMGRRAEAQGNFDYATQFYAYLTESFPGTHEAAEAQAGLDRVARPRERTDAAQGHTHSRHPGWEESPPAHRYDDVPRTESPSLSSYERTASYPNTAAAPPRQTASQPQSPSLSFPPRKAAEAGFAERETASQPHLGHLAQPGRQSQSRRARNEVRSAADAPLPKIMRSDEEDEETLDFIPGYRVGRFLAFTFILVGWLAFVAGLAFIASAVIGFAGAKPMSGYGGLPIGSLVGVGAALTGIAMIFIGSAAQATFEAANNTRELLEIERAKTGW